ncbi:hypothetical protein EGH21_13415 [Halomicroarcula sp. F13]|uniref:Uncharacterized protein n=1 Tax=Haloarcula rubra TaxID=2487747 RepID=A0AAW4PU26_9EURY|nr:hypothetical protein [Halomicroarcula rubra]MBX0324030.1 hypothetical protein [Halomicroarcula rubra]
MAGESESAGSIDTVGEKISEITDGSRIIRTGRAMATRTTSLIQESYCYRWLTKEPDPDVIVIDLRETYTVGPFITLLDKIIPHVERAWQHSRVGAITTNVYEQLNETVFEPLSETRGYELAVAVLTPPEPPEEEQPSADDATSDDETA